MTLNLFGCIMVRLVTGQLVWCLRQFTFPLYFSTCSTHEPVAPVISVNAPVNGTNTFISFQQIAMQSG